MGQNTIDDAVIEGIRKTISRFRRKPFYYFTEADIHSSLINDITRAAPDITIYRPGFFDASLGHLKHISVSLIHQEYPTHFRYKNNELLEGKISKSGIEKTVLGYKDENDKPYGDRGNFDVGVLNIDFVNEMLKTRGLQGKNGLANALAEIINKNNQKAIARSKNDPENFSQELLYAIEVKFLHPSNVTNIKMLREVVKDDQKLQLARINSKEFVKPINLVFCNANVNFKDPNKKSVPGLIKDYIQNGSIEDRNGILYSHPREVVTILIESYLEKTDKKDNNGKSLNLKKTHKPICSKDSPEWAAPLLKELS